MESKKIAIIGDSKSGKTAFIHAVKGIPISSAYEKTIANEVHPITHNGNLLYLWEFGHYCNWDNLKYMDGVIYITTKDTDYESDKPYVIVKNNHSKFDTNGVLNELLNKL